MRVRVATTALGITAVLLSLPACSTDTTGAKHQTPSSARTGKPADAVQKPAGLSSAALESRLLDQSDLGSGYPPKPERPAQHDDVTVIGCPALSELGGDRRHARLPVQGEGGLHLRRQLLGDLRGAVQRQREETVRRCRPDLRRQDRLPDLSGRRGRHPGRRGLAEAARTPRPR